LISVLNSFSKNEEQTDQPHWSFHISHPMRNFLNDLCRFVSVLLVLAICWHSCHASWSGGGGNKSTWCRHDKYCSCFDFFPNFIAESQPGAWAVAYWGENIVGWARTYSHDFWITVVFRVERLFVFRSFGFTQQLLSTRPPRMASPDHQLHEHNYSTVLHQLKFFAYNIQLPQQQTTHSLYCIYRISLLGTRVHRRSK